MDFRSFFRPPWKGQGQCDVDGQFYPYPNAQAPYNQRGICAAGSYWPYPDGGAKRDRENGVGQPPDPQTYATSNDGYTVPVADRTPAVGSPSRPMQGPVMPTMPLDVPLPPERPAGLEDTSPTALQRYQAATTTPSFGSTAPLPPVRPEENGPPMPMQGQVVAQQPLGIPGNSPMSDPSSPQSFQRQEVARSVGVTSGSLLTALFHNVGSGGPAAGPTNGRAFNWVRPDSIVGKLMSLMGDQGQGQPVPSSQQGGQAGGGPSMQDQMQASHDAGSKYQQQMSQGASGGSGMDALAQQSFAALQDGQRRMQAMQAQARAQSQAGARTAQMRTMADGNNPEALAALQRMLDSGDD